jgi:hypothetical protein
VKALPAAVALLCAMAVAGVRADDQVSPFPGQVIIGQQFEAVVQVDAPPGAEVEINTVSPGWSGVEVVSVELVGSTGLADGSVRHTFNLTLAAFALGERQVTPSVFITQEGVSTERVLPATSLAVAATLPANAPLELSPLEAPGSVAGAQSPWLVPILAGAAVLAALSMLLGLAMVGRWWLRRPRTPRDDALPAPSGVPGVEAVEAELLTNPVAAYRAMALLVRESLASRYGFPARALTTRELARRMEAEGVDRWQARLVGGLLEECDAVVYAGYRPAPERRTADLTMAMQVLEATG